MKVLDTDSAIALLPLSRLDREAAARLFAEQAPPNVTTENWLTYAANEGWMECLSVTFEGLPAYVVWFHLNNVGIHFNGAVAKNGNNFPVLMAAMDKIARDNQRQVITCNTALAGIVRMMEKFGYKTESVRLVKTL